MPLTPSIAKDIAAIRTDLALNTQSTKQIVERLDKLNGTIANHESRIVSAETTNVLTAQTLSALKDAQIQSVSAKSNWLDWLTKGAVVFALIVIYNLLIHANILTQLVTPK